MNTHQVSRINLSPSVVDCIVFWSKNPIKMLKRLDELNKYYYYFQYTITGYGQRLEPNVVDLNHSIDIFSTLSNIVGPNRVIWRYDPIVYTTDYNFTYHVNNFEKIAHALSKKTKRCVISFVDLYKNIIRKMSVINVNNFTNESIFDLSNKLNRISLKYEIELTTCAEEIDLRKVGIQHGKCIDDKLIYEVFGTVLRIDKDENQRQECGCVASIDIGAYNTCPHNCLYCYANYDSNIVKKNYSLHDPCSPLLFGKIGERDRISERHVFSCKEVQKTLFPKA
jgi:hypothetical protein